MSKNDIKKTLLTFIFVFILIVIFLNVSNFKKKNYSEKISVVKKIIKEKYDKVYYQNNSNYIYTKTNKNDEIVYTIFDLNGNKLYHIENKNELDIKSVMKKYYIVYKDKYYLYNNNKVEITSGKNIESINDNLIKVDNRIINIDNEVLFDNIKKVNTFDNGNYININDYYLVDKKGKVILKNAFVEKEVSNYLIINKGKKYYTFFLNFEKIMGDGFDSYEIKDNVYIYINNEKYKVYKTGLRKKVNNKNELNIKTDIIKNIKVKKDKINNIKRIDKNNYTFSIKDVNYLYNTNNKKIIYKSNYNLDEIIIFNNNYKTVKKDNYYLLLNNNDEVIKESNKQIVIDKNIKVGKVNDEFYLYDKGDIYLSKKIKISNKIFYQYKKNNKTILIDNSFEKKYEANLVLYYEKIIVLDNKDDIKFYNTDNNKTNIYKKTNNQKVVSDNPYRNIIVLEDLDNIYFVDLKGNEIKIIKNTKLKNYYYNDSTGKLIIITSKENKEGSYVAE